jgi:hypothetical protein
MRRASERRCLLSDKRRILGPSEQPMPLRGRGSSPCRRESSVEQLTAGRGAAGADAAAQSPPTAASPLLGISRRGALGRRTGQAATSAAGESPGKALLGPFRRSRVILDAQPAGQPIGLRGWRWGSGLGAGIRCVGAAQASGGEAVVAQGMGGGGMVSLGKDEVKGNESRRLRRVWSSGWVWLVWSVSSDGRSA